MRRNSLRPHATVIGGAFAAVVLAGILFASVPARADIDVRINIGNAPPAPRLIFQARPNERFYPGEGVYIVDDPRAGDYDCFRYGGYYWMFRDGYWYRAPNWRTRFVVINPRYVPAVFYRMPPTRWKHHPSGPPNFTGNHPGVPQRSVREPGNRPPGLAKKSADGPPAPANRGGDDHEKGKRGKK